MTVSKRANARAIYCASLRVADTSDPDGVMAHLQSCDALITTVLAGGGTVAGKASAGGDDEAWDVGALAGLDVPIIQGLALTSSRVITTGTGTGLIGLSTSAGGRQTGALVRRAACRRRGPRAARRYEPPTRLSAE